MNWAGVGKRSTSRGVTFQRTLEPHRIEMCYAMVARGFPDFCVTEFWTLPNRGRALFVRNTYSGQLLKNKTMNVIKGVLQPHTFFGLRAEMPKTRKKAIQIDQRFASCFALPSICFCVSYRVCILFFRSASTEIYSAQCCLTFAFVFTV